VLLKFLVYEALMHDRSSGADVQIANAGGHRQIGNAPTDSVHGTGGRNDSFLAGPAIGNVAHDVGFFKTEGCAGYSRANAFEMGTSFLLHRLNEPQDGRTRC
jgi:hypothetical protein